MISGWRTDGNQRRCARDVLRRVARLRDTLDDCIGCGCLSIDRCRLRNPADQLANEGPGPRRLLGRKS